MDVIMSERGMDKWNDLQLFWSESWMMKYMFGLDIRYGSPKKASLESVKEFRGKKTWTIRMEGCS